MSGRTPGPWVHNEDGDIIGADGSYVAFGHEGQRAIGLDADAALIAAAPNLLASLEYLMSIICPQGDERYLTISLTPEYFYHARAAIAKAKGESK